MQQTTLASDTAAPRLTVDLAGAFLVAAAVMAVCLLLTGTTLGLFFGGILLAVMLSPYAAMLADSWPRCVVVLAGVIDGIGAVWLFAVLHGEISLLQWLLAYVLLASVTLAAAGVACLLARLRIHPLFASGLTVLTSIAWLAWPIWLAPHIGSARLINALVAIHPLLAMNGIMRHLGIWTEHALMYRLTNLGQDVAYHLPSPLPAIAVHAAIGFTMIAILMRSQTSKEK